MVWEEADARVGNIHISFSKELLDAQHNKTPPPCGGVLLYTTYNMKKVIGLVGEKGSGKGTFVKFFSQIAQEKGLSVVSVKSSDILSETLSSWGIDLTRSNLQQLAIIMNAKYGDTTLSHAVEMRITRLLHSHDIVIYDGIRWNSDVAMVRKFSNNMLVYITAPSEVRYNRTRLRKEKVGEDIASFEQFMEEEKVSTETDIPRIGGSADVKIVNNSTEDQLICEIKSLI
jgi:dephospho-CoA kinase